MRKSNRSLKVIEALLGRVSSPYHPRTYLDLKKVDRDLTRIKPEDRVIIEAGAGLCLDLLYWMGRYASLNGLAMDIDKEALTTAQSWAKEMNIHSRLHFCRADALNQPFRNGQADVCVSFSSIEHLPDKKLAQRWIDEMSRITREAGTVVITTSNQLWPSRAILQTLERISKTWHTDELFFHPDDLGSMLEKAGLQPVALAGGVFITETFSHPVFQDLHTYTLAY